MSKGVKRGEVNVFGWDHAPEATLGPSMSDSSGASTERQHREGRSVKVGQSIRAISNGSSKWDARVGGARGRCSHSYHLVRFLGMHDVLLA